METTSWQCRVSERWRRVKSTVNKNEEKLCCGFWTRVEEKMKICFGWVIYDCYIMTTDSTSSYVRCLYWDKGLGIFLCGFVAKLFPMNIRNSRNFFQVLEHEHKLFFSFIIIVVVVVLICYMSTDRFNSLINIFFLS